MKVRGFVVALSLAGMPAFAASTFESGGKTLRINDAESAVVSAFGQPTRKVEVADSRGNHVGDYYYYTVDAKTIRFLIKNERVTEIFEMH